MLKELFTAALGMQNQQTRLEVTANNMANASTKGFKRSGVFERNLIDARANFYNTKGDVEQNDPPIGSYVDYSAGAFEQTDNPLDLAIDGDGFFLLKDEEGKDFLTRAGNFKINEEGVVVSFDGKKLQGTNGDIVIDDAVRAELENASESKALKIDITSKGEVNINDKTIASIVVAEVDDKNTLQRISNQDFIGTWTADSKIKDQESVSIKQGWIENSNVNIIQEMVTMIELQRMFETGSKVIQTNDGTLEKSIQIGRYM